MSQTKATPESVRQFLLKYYAAKLEGAGKKEIGDDFDFMLEGVIDSLGVLEMVGAVEKEFGMELDMSGMDTEKLTVIGPFSQYVAAQSGKAGA
jgi:acyl carrier protein